MKIACRKQRRKNLSRTRSGSSKRAVRVLAAGLAIAVIGAGTGAYADAIRFDNPAGPGHFDWYGGGVDPDPPIGLEIISDAASQTGVYGGVGQFQQSNELPNNDYVGGGVGGGLLQVGGYANAFLVGVDAGVSIPSGTPWSDHGYILHPNYGTWLPPVGTETYLGVSFPMGGQLHYGWIGVEVLTITNPTGDVLALDAFAWGYETDPGVPIEAGIPEPGTLALLPFGALAAAGRRRRA